MVFSPLSDDVSYKRRRWPRASSLIVEETNEHRTLNVQRPTSNTEFCQFKKILNNTRRKRLVCAIESTRRIPTPRRALQASIHFFKIDKAYRHPHWTFDVGRSTG
jgi:hypothetical protein